MNKETLKMLKRISREEFKGVRLGSRVIKSKKTKEEKYNKYTEYNDDDFEYEQYWEHPKKLERRRA